MMVLASGPPVEKPTLAGHAATLQHSSGTFFPRSSGRQKSHVGMFAAMSE